MARGCAKGLGFHGVIYLLKAIRTARDTNLQKAMRSPFLVGKGPGDRSYEEGEEPLSFVLRRVLKGDSVMDDSSMSLGDWSRLASYSLSTLNSHCQLSVRPTPNSKLTSRFYEKNRLQIWRVIGCRCRADREGGVDSAERRPAAVCRSVRARQAVRWRYKNYRFALFVP